MISGSYIKGRGRARMISGSYIKGRGRTNMISHSHTKGRGRGLMGGTRPHEDLTLVREPSRPMFGARAPV